MNRRGRPSYTIAPERNSRWTRWRRSKSELFLKLRKTAQARSLTLWATIERFLLAHGVRLNRVVLDDDEIAHRKFSLRVGEFPTGAAGCQLGIRSGCQSHWCSQS